MQHIDRIRLLCDIDHSPLAAEPYSDFIGTIADCWHGLEVARHHADLYLPQFKPGDFLYRTGKFAKSERLLPMNLSTFMHLSI